MQQPRSYIPESLNSCLANYYDFQKFNFILEIDNLNELELNEILSI